MIWCSCFVKYKTNTSGQFQSLFQSQGDATVFIGEKRVYFCVPAQCMAALQDYKQRNSNHISESREGDFTQGKLSKMQNPPQFLLQDCNHPLLTQNGSEIVAGRQHCNSLPSPESVLWAALRPYLCCTGVFVRGRFATSGGLYPEGL